MVYLLGLLFALLFFVQAYMAYELIRLRKAYDEEMQEIRMQLHIQVPIKLPVAAKKAEPADNGKVVTGLYVPDEKGGMILAENAPQKPEKPMSDEKLAELQQTSRFKRLG